MTKQPLGQYELLIHDIIIWITIEVMVEWLRNYIPQNIMDTIIHI